MLGRVFFDRNLQLLNATKYTPDLYLKRAWLAFLTEEQMEEDRARFYSPVVYLCSCWHTHTQSQSRERSTGLRFVRFCLQQQFCNYSKCFSNLYAHFFVFVSAAPLLCRCTLCRELIWQNDDSSESVQCINDFVFWISSLCSSLFFLCKLFVVQSINAVPTREAQTNRNYVHIQQICSSK